LSDGAVIVQFLRGSYQLSAEEIIQRKQEFRWDKHGLVLSVMHPIHCVEEKLGLVCRMDQSGRQDLRHLKMALYFVPLFITDAFLNGGTEASLGMCQRILKLAKFIGRARRTPAPSLDPFERNDSASIIVFTRAVTITPLCSYGVAIFRRECAREDRINYARQLQAVLSAHRRYRFWLGGAGEYAAIHLVLNTIASGDR
jgi:hypothetical protein